MAPVGGSMIGGSLMVMAWSGLYFTQNSRTSRSVEHEFSYTTTEVSPLIYDVRNFSLELNISDPETFRRKEKVKEVI